MTSRSRSRGRSQNRSRSNGLALIALGMLAFAGTNAERLPAEAFWPALAICVIGVIVFLKANHEAMERAERRTARALHPSIRNPSLERFAERQAHTDGRALAEAAASERHHAPAQADPEADSSARPIEPIAATDESREIVLCDLEQSSPQDDDDSDDDDFVVTSDVSFPVALQERNAIGDQIEKLERLRDQGILSDEEFSLAKAKLLR